MTTKPATAPQAAVRLNINGACDRHANIVIRFNAQDRGIPSPTPGCVWLPCRGCGALCEVPTGTASFLCDDDCPARAQGLEAADDERAEVYRGEHGELYHLTTCNVGWRVVHNVPADGMTCCNTAGCVCGYDGDGVPEQVTDEAVIADFWRGMADLATRGM